MSELFTEIDEALRKEQAYKFWHKWKGLIISAAAIIIIGGAAIQGFLYYQTQQQEKAAIAFWQAVDDFTAAQDQQQAQDSALAAMSKDKGNDYAMLAEFTLANQAVNDGEFTNARQLYLDLSVSPYVDKKWQDFAKAQAIRAGLPLLPSVNSGTIANEIRQLMADSDVYYYYGLLLKAQMHLALGERDQALNDLKTLIQDETPSPYRSESILSHAREIYMMIGGDLALITGPVTQ